jgi:hypothetical protein
MLEQNLQLSNNMRISADPKKLEKLSQRHIKFYLKYSSFVFKTLKKHSFQKFLRWMLKNETIKEQIIKAVQVKVLPFRRKNGHGVAGKCNTATGKIRIYPKTIKFCQIFKQKFGRNNLLAYAGNRARAALIHEILHLKYAQDEKTVRELAKKYFGIFTQRQCTQSGRSLFIYRIIFDAKISSNSVPSNGSNAPRTNLNLNETCLRASVFFK